MSPVALGVTPPLPPDAWLRRSVAGLPFPLAGASRLHAQARAALHGGLRSLGLGPGDEALLPAYHHGSEVEAYVRAGITVRFMDLEPGRPPDTALIDRIATPATRAVHMIHYLGLAEPVDQWRALADERGWLLVEDVAQGWLGHAEGRPLGSTGDIALFSVYKSVGVPDGGVAIVRGERVTPTGSPALGLVAAARRHAVYLAGRNARLGTLRSRRAGARRYDLERDMDLGDPERPAARVTIPLLRRLAVDDVADRRAATYARLAAELDPWVAAPWNRDPARASPFALPVRVRNKAAVLAALRAAGIGAVDLWSVPHPALAPGEHPRATERRARTVLLPVHQELRPVDVEHIAAVARRVLAEDS